MGTVAKWGIQAFVPSAWDARLYKRTPSVPGEQTAPILHMANFALPQNRGDFGGGAVEMMSPQHVFVALLEYGQNSVGTQLFAARGIPKRVTPSSFHENVLHRALPGQAGTQYFFTESGRAFSLYIVLGSSSNRIQLVPKVNSVLPDIALTAASGMALQ